MDFGDDAFGAENPFGDNPFKKGGGGVGEDSADTKQAKPNEQAAPPATEGKGGAQAPPDAFAGEDGDDDPFGDTSDPFEGGASAPAPTTGNDAPAAAAVANMDDFFGDVAAPAAAAATANDDPFGEGGDAASPAGPAASANTNDDPFGEGDVASPAGPAAAADPNDDPFGEPAGPGPAAADNSQSQPQGNANNDDPFGDDSFNFDMGSAAPTKKQPKPVESKSSAPLSSVTGASNDEDGSAADAAKGQAKNAAGDFGFDEDLFGETSAEPSQTPAKVEPSSAEKEAKASPANDAGAAAAPADESNPFGDGFFDDGAEADNPFEAGGGGGANDDDDDEDDAV